VEMGGQVTDASKLWTHRCGAPIKETQDEDPGRQGGDPASWNDMSC